MSSTSFYSSLPQLTSTINKLVVQPSLFSEVPKDWIIIITDIKGSTAAVQKGFSQNVNLIATGSIIAVLNIAKKSNIDIPFFFGGDGATMIIPPELRDETDRALTIYRNRVKKEYDLNLRVGQVSVSKIYEANKLLHIAKVKRNSVFSIPIVLGDGLKYAEELIKAADHETWLESEEEELDLDGMECRWNQIAPPNESDLIICLLVEAQSEINQPQVFKQVLDQIDFIYGDLDNWHPISKKRLKLDTRYVKMRNELRVKLPGYSQAKLFKTWFETVLGKYLYFTAMSDGKQYLEDVIQLSDIFLIDGRINMVFSSTQKQLALLVDYLEYLENEGLLRFGYHSCSHSIMSCYVQNRKSKHIHFVDGIGGGYTQAARMIKSKLY